MCNNLYSSNIFGMQQPCGTILPDMGLAKTAHTEPEYYKDDDGGNPQNIVARNVDSDDEVTDEYVAFDEPAVDPNIDFAEMDNIAEEAFTNMWTQRIRDPASIKPMLEVIKNWTDYELAQFIEYPQLAESHWFQVSEAFKSLYFKLLSSVNSSSREGVFDYTIEIMTKFTKEEVYDECMQDAFSLYQSLPQHIRTHVLLDELELAFENEVKKPDLWARS